MKYILLILFLFCIDAFAIIKESPIKVISFNTGTTKSEAAHQTAPENFSKKDAKIADKYYGNGLAWTRAIEATKKYITKEKPDIIGFQELFHSPNCKSIPKKAHKEFVCETWKEGDPTVVQYITSGDYQIACHLGTNHKCIAVKKSFAKIRGCNSEICLNFLNGAIIDECYANHSRIGQAVLDLNNGDEINVVHVHGSSGLSKNDKRCRKKEFQKVFLDIGDGEPAANGHSNIILGDFNTDPKRMKWLDKSAKKLKKYAKKQSFYFLNFLSDKEKPTYKRIVSLDHILSDVFSGECHSAGITKGYRAVLDTHFFDHKPLVCRVKRH